VTFWSVLSPSKLSGSRYSTFGGGGSSTGAGAGAGVEAGACASVFFGKG
jgi:hypothetical protein